MTKKRLATGLAAMVAAVAVVATTFAPGAGAARPSTEGTRPTIAGLVASSGSGFDHVARDYDILLAAVNAAGLVETLDRPDLDVTVWAPRDRAFVRTARDLGFTGTVDDEAGAWAFLVNALTAIGGGDPIPTLTTILLYHVTPDARGSARVLAARGFPTLADIRIGHTPGSLVLRDKDPDFANPRLVNPLNVRASNGVIHNINRVLLPVDL